MPVHVRPIYRGGRMTRRAESPPLPQQDESPDCWVGAFRGYLAVLLLGDLRAEHVSTGGQAHLDTVIAVQMVGNLGKELEAKIALRTGTDSHGVPFQRVGRQSAGTATCGDFHRCGPGDINQVLVDHTVRAHPG